MKRRRFIQKTTAGALGLTALTQASSGMGSGTMIDDQPVIKDLKKSITAPVIIDKIDLVNIKGEHFVIAYSKDGTRGICQGNSRLDNMTVMFKNQVASYFVGKDARELLVHLDRVYLHNRNYKYAGMPLWNCVAHVELALLDLMGHVAQQPVSTLLGDVLRTDIPVYMSSTERGTTAEEEVAWVGERVAATNSRAVKLKIGGRMSKNADASPGRSEKLIELSRKTWGDDMEIYFDANGSYDVPNAIEWGKMLEEYRVGFYEEPVPWEDFFATKQVADALDIIVAGGEQDSSLPKWEWMINQGAFQLVQPDIMYNGGMVRTLQVAQMAAAKNIPCTLHSPKNNALAAYMLHFAAICPNLGPYQEFRAKLPKNPKNYYTPQLIVENGSVKVPTGTGFGIEYDEEYLKKGKVV